MNSPKTLLVKLHMHDLCLRNTQIPCSPLATSAPVALLLPTARMFIDPHFHQVVGCKREPSAS